MITAAAHRRPVITAMLQRIDHTQAATLEELRAIQQWMNGTNERLRRLEDAELGVLARPRGIRAFLSQRGPLKSEPWFVFAALRSCRWLMVSSKSSYARTGA